MHTQTHILMYTFACKYTYICICTDVYVHTYTHTHHSDWLHCPHTFPQTKSLDPRMYCVQINPLLLKIIAANIK